MVENNIERKWWQDDNGNMSSLRIIIVPGAYIGFITILSGLAAMYLSLPDAGTALTVGAGIVATSQGAKAWQKRSESNKQNN